MWQHPEHLQVSECEVTPFHVGYNCASFANIETTVWFDHGEGCAICLLATCRAAAQNYYEQTDRHSR
jgi:hypothetical protein